MEILNASKSDLEEVSQLTGQALNEGSVNSYTVDNVKATSLMEKVLANNGKLLVVKESEQLAGWVLFGSQKDSITDEEIGFIYEIYILKNYRKKGFAKRLLEKCITDLKTQGLKNVRLVVYKGNKAIQIYEEFGFIENRIVMNKAI
ncbi:MULTISPECIES: GNAT family N-acetyltransferase [Bacillus cereus group]|uniref:N-acetyltransferase domain-containing protein n=1 Tax=Bacillus cereus TaxID=1396 RepID=A0A0G8ERQ4_BACCE|nr:MULTISPECIES: N-acetyltransferase [Bacillus cereus group]KLA26147.1 hypothetical protein B4077_6037 [Bacillus cereus]MBE7097360.1 GNAT family N-acetyltransferase [Bacillus cereus]MED2038573.1 N-acetyltransferase [Bacillus wiedmannii]